jgi:hypothetical protein
MFSPTPGAHTEHRHDLSAANHEWRVLPPRLTVNQAGNDFGSDVATNQPFTLDRSPCHDFDLGFV